MTRSIRLQLVLAFNVFLAALAVLGYFLYRDVDRSRDLSGQMRSDLVNRVEHAAHLDEQLDRLRHLSVTYILAEGVGQRQQTAAELAPLLGEIDRGTAEYRQTFGEGPPPADLVLFVEGYEAYLPQHERMLAATDAGRQQEALSVYVASSADFQALTGALHRLRHGAYEEAQGAARDTASALGRVEYVLIGGLAAAAAIIFAVGHPLSTSVHRRLQALLEGIKRVGRGELDRPIAVKGNDEVAALAQAFNTMIASLRSARDEVIALHNQALSMQQERVALLESRVGQVVKAQEEERRRVARELHDQAGQVLTALQLGLSRLQMESPAPEVEGQARSLRELALEAMGTVRNLALDLRPSSLDELGLPVALRDYVDTFSKRTGIAATLVTPGTWQRLAAETEVALFRIAQEGLTNVAKHSEARQVTVGLALEGPALRLMVEDDGVGFDPERALGPDRGKSLGLMGIQERCHLLGGEFLIQSRPREGTKLIVSVPLSGNGVAGEEASLAGRA